MQNILRQYLATGAQRFSINHFQEGIKSVVSQFFQEKYDVPTT